MTNVGWGLNSREWFAVGTGLSPAAGASNLGAVASSRRLEAGMRMTLWESATLAPRQPNFMVSAWEEERWTE